MDERRDVVERWRALGLGTKKAIGMPEKGRRKKKGWRGPRSKTGNSQCPKTGTIKEFTVLMNSLKEGERLKESGARKRVGDEEKEDMVGPGDKSESLFNETFPEEADTLELGDLGKIPESRMVAGRGAKSETGKEPRKKKLKLFKQIKGQGLIDWTSGRVPGEFGKEGGCQDFKRKPQKQVASEAFDTLCMLVKDD